MYIFVIVCTLFGVLLAKAFDAFILIPAFALIVGFDLFIDHDAAWGAPGIALEIALFVTSLQIGYFAGALSPLFLSALAGRKIRAPDIFREAPFSRASSGAGRTRMAPRSVEIPARERPSPSQGA